MIKKKILILSMVAIMLNVPMKSYSYSLNNIQLATSDSSGSSSGGGESTPPTNDSTQTPSSGAGNGSNGQTTPPKNQGNSSVTMDGAIGEWEPGNSNLPNFNTGEGEDKLEVENKPTEGKYYTISATVPLNMEFLIKNENENGSSPNGKFITPYYKVTNNGSHTLNVYFESFEYGDNLNRGNSKTQLEQLYVVERPTKGNGKVEMKLNLTYDRPFNSYFKKFDLVPSNASSVISRLLNLRSGTTKQILGKLDANEEARLYYGSDEWESPKSEGITTGVEADFDLRLAFSIDKETTETTPPAESPDGPPEETPEDSTE